MAEEKKAPNTYGGLSSVKEQVNDGFALEDDD
jgi:hypothetical protein